MGDNVPYLPSVDLSTATRTFREINDIWNRNFPQILIEHERCKEAYEKLKETHKKDFETIRNLKTLNEKLNDNLEKQIKDKEIYASEIQDLKADLDGALRKLHDVSEERDVSLRKLVNCQKQLGDLQDDVQKKSSESIKMRNELCDATEVINSLQSQINLDRNEFEQRLKEQENSARIRMEDQKAEIERRMREECNSKIRKYDAAHNKMKTDFENALGVAQEETNKLALQRNEYYVKYVALQEQINEHKKRTHAQMQRLVAEKCREMVNQICLLQKDPEQKREFLRSPDFFASRFMKEMNSDGSDKGDDVPENGGIEEEDEENITPLPKIRRKK